MPLSDADASAAAVVVVVVAAVVDAAPLSLLLSSSLPQPAAISALGPSTINNDGMRLDLKVMGSIPWSVCVRAWGKGSVGSARAARRRVPATDDAALQPRDDQEHGDAEQG